MERDLDFLDYCYRLHRIGPRRVRVLIFVAPGYADEVAKRLKPQGMHAVVRNLGCVGLSRPESVATFLSLINAPGPTKTAAWQYAKACQSSVKGFRTDETVRSAQASAVDALMELQPVQRRGGTK